MKALAPSLATAWLALAAPTLALSPTTTAAPLVFDQDDYEDDRSELVPDAVERLEAAAKACQKAKALRERNEIYEAILELDGDHKMARKVLKYTKDRKTGEWVRKRAYKLPKATKPDAAAEVAPLRTEAGTPFVDGVMKLLEKHEEELEPLYVYGQLALAMKIAPDHGALRGRLGYVQVDGEGPWILEEIARTEARREEIAARVDEIREGIEDPEPKSFDKDEETWGLDLVEPIGNKRVRVVADGEYEEREDVVREMEVAWTLLHDLTAKKPRKLKGMSVYLLADEAVAESLVDACRRWEGRTAKDGAKYMIQRGDSYRAGSNFVMCYRDDGPHRLDSAVSESVDAFLERNFRVTSFQGWATLGIRFYTTELLLGTRMTFPNAADVTLEMQRKARKGELGDWNARARDLMREAGSKFLDNLIERSSSGMIDEHVIISYAFVAYLFEGHEPELVGKILSRVVKGEQYGETRVFEEELGMPIEILQDRFTTWLEATTPGPVAMEAAAPKTRKR